MATPLSKRAIAVVAEALEKLERPKAKERQSEAGKTHGRGKIASENFTEAIASGETRDKVGAAIGMSGVTYQRALAAIRDSGKPSRRLYRQTHPTFEDYCRDRWGLSKQRTYQFIHASERYSALEKSKKFDFLPRLESHVAQLGRLESDEQACQADRRVRGRSGAAEGRGGEA